jgi:hypothetical protein
MAQQFTESRAHSNPPLGCVGAVDGIAVKLRSHETVLSQETITVENGSTVYPSRQLLTQSIDLFLFLQSFPVLRMILLHSAHPALDKNFIPQACLQDTGLLAMPLMFVPSLCWFRSRRRIFSTRTRGFGATHSISSSLACGCTLNKLLAYLCIDLVFYGVHWNLIYLEVVELYLHVL